MNVEFLGSFTSESLPAQSYPEVAVAGRSNVGKTSFINALVARRKVAHVSSKPGKTRTINLYLCNRDFVLADLPGYGYSRASKTERTRWARDIETYLSRRVDLRATVLVIDVRHFPMEIDLEALDWLSGLSRPVLAVFTKADKLGRQELNRRRTDISGICAKHSIQYAIFSAKTGLGRKEVWNWIERTVHP